MAYVRTFLLPLALVLSGCFQISSVLTVRADGSASLRDEVTLSGFGLRALQDAASEGGESPRSLFEATDAAGRAEALGEGVRLASFEARDDGYVAVYEIASVEALHYSAPQLPDADAAADAGESPVLQDLAFSFAFVPGSPALLQVNVPKPESAALKPEQDPAGDADAETQERMLAVLRDFFAGARMQIAVRVEGEIVETDASYASGSSVTLFDLPVEAVFDLIEDDPSAARGVPAAVLRQSLADRGDVRIEAPGTVRIRFR